MMEGGTGAAYPLLPPGASLACWNSCHTSGRAVYGSAPPWCVEHVIGGNGRNEQEIDSMMAILCAILFLSLKNWIAFWPKHLLEEVLATCFWMQLALFFLRSLSDCGSRCISRMHFKIGVNPLRISFACRACLAQVMTI